MDAFCKKLVAVKLEVEGPLTLITSGTLVVLTISFPLIGKLTLVNIPHCTGIWVWIFSIDVCILIAQALRNFNYVNCKPCSIYSIVSIMHSAVHWITVFIIDDFLIILLYHSYFGMHHRIRIISMVSHIE